MQGRTHCNGRITRDACMSLRAAIISAGMTDPLSPKTETSSGIPGRQPLSGPAVGGLQEEGGGESAALWVRVSHHRLHLKLSGSEGAPDPQRSQHTGLSGGFLFKYMCSFFSSDLSEATCGTLLES